MQVVEVGRRSQLYGEALIWTLRFFRVMNFGSYRPVDLICQRNHRFPYVAAFSISAWSVFNVLAGHRPLQLKTNIPAVQSLLNLAACILFAIIFYPVFAAITSSHVIGYALGAVYVWMLTIIYTLTNYPCEEDEVRDQVYMALRFLPCIIWMLYLCVYFPVSVRRKLKDAKGDAAHTYRSRTFEDEYVRRLLNKKYTTPVPYVESWGKPGSIGEKITRFIFRKVYAPVKGYRYPVSMLTAASMSSILLWATGLTLLQYYQHLSTVAKVSVMSALDDNVQVAINNMTRNAPLFKVEALAESIIGNSTYWAYPKKIYESIQYAMYLSFSLALLVNIVSMFLTLRNYRKDILLVYGGRNGNIPSWKKKTPSKIVAAGSKYVGYQFAYSLWGFLVQAVFLLILCIVVGYFVIASVKGNSQVLGFIYSVLPPIILAYVITLIQRIVVHFFFLRKDEKGHRVLALNRILTFLNFQYFMVFMNSAVGIVTCLLRMIKSVVFGIFTLQRLDISSMSRTFERFDNGFKAYVYLLAIENVQTNPILVTFVDLLMQTTFHRKTQELFQTRLLSNGEDGHTPPLFIGPSAGKIDTDPLSISKSVSSRSSLSNSKRRNIARNRWRLAVTLYHNPYLRHYRMRNQQAIFHDDGHKAFLVASQIARLEMMLRECQEANPSIKLRVDESGAVVCAL